MNYSTYLESLINGNDLDAEQTEAIMTELMSGSLTDAQIGAFLTALRIKGESIAEITAAAKIMRANATTIDVGTASVVDTCGTGGDGASTFNISTAAAFVAAGAGVVIAKHGNKSVSSKCGSADVLAELGVNLDLTPDQVGECVATVGIGFLFAPKLHPAMKHAIGPRRELGVRTIFNMLGPLTNPAGAKRQVLGVFAEELTETFANVLKNLGSSRAMIVHGNDHLDELTVTTTTVVSELKNGDVSSYTFDPRPHIGDYHTMESIRGGDAPVNAKIVQQVLSGEQGACADIAILNGAAAIYVGDDDIEFAEAVAKARASISSGEAMRKLNELITISNG